MNSRQPRGKDPYLQSLARGLRFLEFFVGEPKGLLLTEAAQKASIELTAAYRIAHTLEQTGYLVRDTDRRYQLGPRAGEMGLAFLSTLDFRRVALSHMHALASSVREAVSLATLSGGRAVVIERIESPHAITTRGQIGGTFPAHATSMGKTLLAFKPEEFVRPLLEEMTREAFTPSTKTSLTDLFAEFKEIRRVGYAINDEESDPGVRAVAAPIRDGLGEVVASVNVSGPAARISREVLTTVLAGQVVETAAAISAGLGHRVEIGA